MQNRRMMLGIAALLAVVAIARHPNADIRVLTHDAADRAPHQLKAAFDFGVVGVSLLVTWTGKHIS